MPNHAKHLRQNMTDAERTLWQYLRARQLGYRFRRQHRIGPYIADFSCYERHLIIELDGSQHLDRMLYDARRTRYLEAHGDRVLRFWNHDVLLRTEAVLQAIDQAL